MTTHLVMPEPPQDDAFLHDVAVRLRETYHIDHATIQLESGGCVDQVHDTGA